jgi:hypothetical protein
MADVRYFQKYLDRGLDSAEAKYASLIEGMDKSLGDVIDFIETKGIKNNTVIFSYPITVVCLYLQEAINL